jgi:hypothetical protein
MNTVRSSYDVPSDSADHCPVNPKNGRPASMISKETYEIIAANAEILDSAIIYNRDFNYN